VKDDQAQRNANNTKLDAILSPLRFQAARPGIYVQRHHPWIQFDLTAIDPKPEVVIPYIMDKLWDLAVVEGKRRHQAELRDLLGIK